MKTSEEKVFRSLAFQEEFDSFKNFKKGNFAGPFGRYNVWFDFTINTVMPEI